MVPSDLTPPVVRRRADLFLYQQGLAESKFDVRLSLLTHLDLEHAVAELGLPS